MATRMTSRAIFLASFAALAVLGCSSPGAPSAAQPTVLVTNPLCDRAGHCRTLQIRAFVWAFTIPQRTDGIKVLGEVEGPTACLTFPAVWQVIVKGVDSTGAVTDSTTYTWSPGDPDGVFLTGVD
jgi:hypothetical protein